MSRGWAAVIAAALLAAGCTSSGSAPAPTPSATPTPTTSATTPAGEAMGRLAGLAATASYQASYVASQRHPRSNAVWRVWHTPKSVRVDVVDRGVIATLIVTPKGSYSCRRKGRRRTCFLVARAGKPVPAPFNLAPQSLFTADVAALARSTGTYRVSGAGSNDGGPGRPSSTCFAIHATATSPRPRVATGVYCFAASGALTSVRYPSGNTVLLTRLHMRTPPTALFRPYSSPTPLPG